MGIPLPCVIKLQGFLITIENGYANHALASLAFFLSYLPHLNKVITKYSSHPCSHTACGTPAIYEVNVSSTSREWWWRVP